MGVDETTIRITDTSLRDALKAHVFPRMQRATAVLRCMRRACVSWSTFIPIPHVYVREAITESDAVVLQRSIQRTQNVTFESKSFGFTQACRNLHGFLSVKQHTNTLADVSSEVRALVLASEHAIYVSRCVAETTVSYTERVSEAAARLMVEGFVHAHDVAHEFYHVMPYQTEPGYDGLACIENGVSSRSTTIGISLALLLKENGGDTLNAFALRGSGLLLSKWSVARVRQLVQGLREARRLESVSIGPLNEDWLIPSPRKDGVPEIACPSLAEFLTALAGNTHLKDITLSLVMLTDLRRMEGIRGDSNNYVYETLRAVVIWVATEAKHVEVLSIDAESTPASGRDLFVFLRHIEVKLRRHASRKLAISFLYHLKGSFYSFAPERPRGPAAFRCGFYADTMRILENLPGLRLAIYTPFTDVDPFVLAGRGWTTDRFCMGRASSYTFFMDYRHRRLYRQ